MFAGEPMQNRTRYLMAEQQGHAVAQTTLGVMYDNGEGAAMAQHPEDQASCSPS